MQQKKTNVQQFTKYALLCMLIVAAPFLHAQKKLNKKQFIKDSIEIMRPKLVRPQFKIDNRLVFYKKQSIPVNGIDAGVLLKSKLRVTLGYYWLNDNLSFFKKTVNGADIDRHLALKYGSINTEFIYMSSRFFSLGMPLEFGFGRNELTYKDFVNNETFSREWGFIMLTDFGLSATFKPLRWIGLKGMAGYRKTLFNQVKGFQFDGFFTSLGLNVDFREIIKDIRMFNLKRKYKRGNSISNAVDLITD